jgi:SAM-dependent methyltransferase
VPDGPEQSTDSDDGNPFAIDFSVAHPARLQSYLAGGESYFAADREAAEKMAAALPSGIDTARGVVRTLGAFVGRAVRYLAGEAGVRQFLHIGVGPPGKRNVYHVAQEKVADPRVVYVSDDPVVLAESHTLRSGSPEGATGYVHGSLLDFAAVVEQAAETLDLDEPVAALLVTTLNFVPDERGPHAIVAEFVEVLAPGSHLLVAHPSFDISAEGMPEASARLSHALKVPWVVRTRDEIARFFDSLDMVEPGLVPIDEWRPEGGHPPPRDGRRVPPIYGGLGRKP